MGTYFGLIKFLRLGVYYIGIESVQVQVHVLSNARTRREIQTGVYIKSIHVHIQGNMFIN